MFISPTPPGSPPPIEGEFNPDLTPNVRICRLNGDSCDEVLSESAKVSRDADQYQLEWPGLNQLRTNFPNNRLYRIEVRSAPISTQHQFFGSVVVQLTDGTGGGLNISGNKLPIKFWISKDVCPESSVCATVYNATGETVTIETNVAALHFEEGFCASSSPSPCQEFITVIASRYRGPERCIPNTGFAVATIQYEVCIRVTTKPANVEFDPQTVFSLLCVDPRTHELAPDHAPEGAKNLLRVLSVKEDLNGHATGTATEVPAANSRPSGVLDFCNQAVFDETPAGSAATASRLGRFAALAERALARVGRYLVPAPVHARRRANIPIVSSPIGFSRLGIVLPVKAVFNNDNSTGSTGGEPNPQPEVCVVAVNPDGTDAVHVLGVPEVRVEFTAEAGNGSVSPASTETEPDGCVSPNWTLASTAGTQSLGAKVGAPARLARIVDPLGGVANLFPNNEPNVNCVPGDPGCYWWRGKTFTATATEAAPFDAFFLSPLGESTSGTNVTDPVPVVLICGPFDPVSQPPPCNQTTTFLTPVLREKTGAWETSWRTRDNTVANKMYRIDVVVGGALADSFHARSGGGGGGTTDPLGSPGNPYVFQSGNTIPIRFKVIAPAP